MTATGTVTSSCTTSTVTKRPGRHRRSGSGRTTRAVAARASPADERADVDDLPLRLVVQGIGANGDLLPDSHRIEVLGVDRHVHPDGGEIRDREEVLVLGDGLSGRDLLLDDHPVEGGPHLVAREDAVRLVEERLKSAFPDSQGLELLARRPMFQLRLAMGTLLR